MGRHLNPRMLVDPMRRFKTKVFVSKLFIEGRPELGPCWLWTGALGGHNDSYGRFQVDGKMHPAHRWHYEQIHGPINRFLVLDHLCKRTRCVSDLHLEIVTQQTNVLRGNGFTAINAVKTHCLHGHEFTAENTEVRSNGHRRCITCRRLERVT